MRDRCLNCGAPFPADVCAQCGARQGVVWEPPAAAAARGRPEAILERHVLRALGGYPDVLAMKNEVGTGYTANALHTVIAALKDELPPDVAAVAARVVARAMARHRITWGLGVGSPDLVLVVRGRWMGVELKSEDGRVSPEQRTWHEAAARRGAPTVVVRSVEEVRAVVDGMRRGEAA